MKLFLSTLFACSLYGQTFTGGLTPKAGAVVNMTAATVTVATQTQADNSTKAASTAYVVSAVAGASVAMFVPTVTAVSKLLANLEHVVVTADGQTMTLPALPRTPNTVSQ